MPSRERILHNVGFSIGAFWGLMLAPRAVAVGLAIGVRKMCRIEMRLRRMRAHRSSLTTKRERPVP